MPVKCNLEKNNWGLPGLAGEVAQISSVIEMADMLPLTHRLGPLSIQAKIQVKLVKVPGTVLYLPNGFDLQFIERSPEPISLVLRIQGILARIRIRYISDTDLDSTDPFLMNIRYLLGRQGTYLGTPLKFKAGTFGLSNLFIDFYGDFNLNCI